MIADGAQFETESSPLVASQGQGWIRQTHRSGSAPPPSHVARRKRGCRRRVVVAFGLTLGSWKATISLHLLTGELPRRIALFPTSPPSSPDPPRSPTFGPPPPPLIRLFRRRRKGKRLLFSVLIRFRKPLLHPLS